MFRRRSILTVADNTGAKKAQCIGILGGTRKLHASIGDVVVVSIKVADPKGSVKKKEVCRGVVVRTRREKLRSDGSYIRFSENAVVLINEKNEPRGTRVFGPVAREVRTKHPKIVSQAPESL